jgi:hypothetical protein
MVPQCARLLASSHVNRCVKAHPEGGVSAYIKEARDTLVTGQSGDLRERMSARDAGEPIDRSHTLAEQLLAGAQRVELSGGVTVERNADGGLVTRTLNLRAAMEQPPTTAAAPVVRPVPNDEAHIVNPFAKETRRGTP